MKKVLATLIISIIILFQVTPAFCANLDIDAASYILIDAKTGSVLYENNPDMKWRPASTTKIATALIALKEGDLNQVMTASNEAVIDIGVGGMQNLIFICFASAHFYIFNNFFPHFFFSHKSICNFILYSIKFCKVFS